MRTYAKTAMRIHFENGGVRMNGSKSVLQNLKISTTPTDPKHRNSVHGMSNGLRAGALPRFGDVTQPNECDTRRTGNAKGRIQTFIRPGARVYAITIDRIQDNE